MTVLAPVSSSNFRAGTPTGFRRPIACDEAEFPVLLRRYRLALALFVAAVAMLFVGFSSAYVVRQGIPTYDPGIGAYSTVWEPLRLPIALLLLNTCLLVIASGAIEVARRKIGLQTLKNLDMGGTVAWWIRASLLFGGAFLVGQGIAWHALASSGQFLSTGARAAFFYVLTTTHALHALIGVLATAAIVIFGAQMSALRRYLAVDLAAWYLHSMTLLWVYLLCFLLLH